MTIEIASIYSRQILDSRGNPTLEAEVIDFNAVGVYPSDHLPVVSLLRE